MVPSTDNCSMNSLAKMDKNLDQKNDRTESSLSNFDKLKFKIPLYPHQKISFITTETKDSNVINDSNHTESCAVSCVES